MGFVCFGTAHLKHTVQKTTEHRYILRNNSRNFVKIYAFKNITNKIISRKLRNQKLRKKTSCKLPVTKVEKRLKKNLDNILVKRVTVKEKRKRNNL
jgi:hypothetical protein